MLHHLATPILQAPNRTAESPSLRQFPIPNFPSPLPSAPPRLRERLSVRQSFKIPPSPLIIPPPSHPPTSEIPNFPSPIPTPSPAVHPLPSAPPRLRESPSVRHSLKIPPSPPIIPPPSHPPASEISNFKSPISSPAPRFALLLILCLQLVLSSAFALSGPQPTLPTITLHLGPTTLQAEVADTPETRAIGLMGRTALEDGHGMLFVFARPQRMSFWMRQTTLPLSIAYINAAGVIREIHDLRPLDETMVASALPDLLYALEVPQGWFTKNKILPGTRIQGLPAPSTAQPN